jgi:tRNA 2-thiouridine synthesizing protein A
MRVRKGGDETMTSEIKPDKTLDVRGEICPNPDVRTMTTLEKMEKGQILEVLVDYPLSVERIPRNVENRKHKVLKVEKISGPEHRILIEAKANK